LGIRESLGKKQSLTVIAALVVLIGSVVAIIVQARGGGMSGVAGDSYYTVDDGATYFVDSRTKNPPFDHDGKQAVRAHLFVCGGKKVVGYLERYTPDALQALEEVKQSRMSGKPPANIQRLQTLGTTGTELKKPGAAEKWVRASAAMRVFRCPDGRVVGEVFPNE
jgi:hypothetical protein